MLKNKLSLRKKLSFEEITDEKKKKAKEDQKVVKLEEEKKTRLPLMDGKIRGESL